MKKTSTIYLLQTAKKGKRSARVKWGPASSSSKRDTFISSKMTERHVSEAYALKKMRPPRQKGKQTFFLMICPKDALPKHGWLRFSVVGGRGELAGRCNPAGMATPGSASHLRITDALTVTNPSHTILYRNAERLIPPRHVNAANLVDFMHWRRTRV